MPPRAVCSRFWLVIVRICCNQFEDLFPSGMGRPSIPASVMASILVLQALHDLSDRETAEAARCDLRWKVATGMALDRQGLTRPRWCIGVNGWPSRIGRTGWTMGRWSPTGVLGGRRKRAVVFHDFADAVATQDTITQLIAAIRRVGRVVPGAAEAITAVCTGHDYSKPGKPVMDWDEPGAKDALVSALVNDANALLGVFAEVDLDEVAEPVAAALSMLALVAGQDVEPAEGSDGTDGRWRIASRVAPDKDDVQVRPRCPAHPQVTRGAPRRLPGTRGRGARDRDHHRRSIDHGRRTENSDAAVAERFLAADTPPRSPATARRPHTATTATRVSGTADTTYGTGDLRGAIGDAGHVAVIKPKPFEIPGRGRVHRR